MIKYWIIIICQRNINIINCAQEGASLINKEGAIKKKMRISFNIKVTLKTVWIYAHASDLDQRVVLLGIWFLCSWGN